MPKERYFIHFCRVERIKNFEYATDSDQAHILDC